ncbi:hypothetical protein [Streptomyces sp. NPDC005385]|uniref:hypothetical protein n=1 Tax=Streptomyces sp. NPDC005385 TaxID=3157039 RepID=UPI0033B1CEEE
MTSDRDPLPTIGEICTDVAVGSMILARRLPVLIGRAWRLLVTFSEGAPEKKAAGKQSGKGSAKTKKKAREKGAAGEKSDEKPDPAEKDTSKGADEAETSGTTATAAGEKEKEPKKERSGWDLLEQLGLGAFTVVIGWVFLRPYLAALVQALAPAAAPLFGTAVVLWIVGAYRAAPRNDHDEKSDEDQGEEQQNAGPDPAEVRAAEQRLWLLVISRVQEAVADGRRGVHLSTLLEEPDCFPPDWDVTRLREHCERLGIPVKTMQIRGSKNRGPTHGVHVDELTAALGMSLAEAFYLLNVGYRLDAQSSLPEAEQGAPEPAPVDPSGPPADTPQPASESTAPAPPVEGSPEPFPGGAPAGPPGPAPPPPPGAHSSPTRTPSDAAARPSPEPHPQPLLEGDRSPGESPSIAPI